MLNAYGKLGVSSPSWMVKVLGESAYRETFTRLAEVHEIGKLLDVGCGSGEKRVVIPKNAKYFGLDHANSKHAAFHTDVLATAYDIPFKNGSFDTLFCTGVLEHLEEPYSAIEESYRVLRPGGYAIYTVPLFWHIHEEPRDFYRYTSYALRYLFEKAGFHISTIDPLSGFWVTAGSMFNYYMSLFARGPFRYAVRFLTSINNLLCFALNRCHKPAKFTWMYLVVAYKPST